ncbi:penicillin-binding protein, partial [Bacillus nitratireducens]|nr:penicillin-binding protein [Bacillus nitratireducens]
GQIFDREGEKVVNNNAIRVITYTRMKGIQSDDILKVAKDLSNIIEISEEDINKLTETDRKDFWMQMNKEQAQKKITKQDEEKLRAKNIEGKGFDNKIEKLRRERVTDEELSKLTPEDLKVLA